MNSLEAEALVLQQGPPQTKRQTVKKPKSHDPKEEMQRLGIGRKLKVVQKNSGGDVSDHTEKSEKRKKEPSSVEVGLLEIINKIQKKTHDNEGEGAVNVKNRSEMIDDRDLSRRLSVPHEVVHLLANLGPHQDLKEA